MFQTEDSKKEFKTIVRKAREEPYRFKARDLEPHRIAETIKVTQA